jgi:Protein of unknown function (DUF3626)
LIVILDTDSWILPSDSPQQKAHTYVAARSHGEPLDPTLRVTVNFHPARFHRGVPLLRCLADDREYRSQFETGTGNGSLSAYPGGERWRWETHLFGGAYDTASSNERPKVGALNYSRRATGAFPRFGSAHLRLRPGIAPHCTVCYPDSCFDPTTEVEALALQLPCSLEWHPGFRLHVDEMGLHPTYRGPEYVTLGRSLALDAPGR